MTLDDVDDAELQTMTEVLVHRLLRCEALITQRQVRSGGAAGSQPGL